MTRYGASRLNGTTLIVLAALITSNKMSGKRDDAEKPFRVGLTKLQKRVGRDQRTITRHFKILENEKLLTVTKNKNGTSSTYSLHLSPMKDWTSADEAETLKRQQRAAAKLKWKRKDKVTKTDLENIYIVDGCVKGCIEHETNRDRRLRQHHLITVVEI
jgi:DNA-binding transcriptional ArsR family regulator